MNRIYQEQLERLHNEKEVMLEELVNWSHDQIGWKSDDESWNANQVVEHLVTSEFGTLQYLIKKTSSGFDLLESATEKNRESSKKLNAALASDKQWKAPPVLPQPKGDKDLDLLINRWRGLSQKLGEWLEQVPKNTEDKLVFRHPLAGRLNLQQTMDFLIEHVIHHGHQLKRIQEKW